MPEVQVRRAGLEDLDILVPLFSGYRGFYGQARDTESDRAFLQQRLGQNESVIFIALLKSKAVGFTQLYPSFSSVALKREWVLNDLYVEPGARGKGVGAGLLKAAQEFGRHDGARRLTLETQADNPARYLYEKLGWQEDEHRHYWIDCL